MMKTLPKSVEIKALDEESADVLSALKDLIS